MSGARIFLIVLVAFALLFAGGVIIGLRQNDSQANTHTFSPPNWTNVLSDWLSPKLDLNTLQTVQGTCLQAARKMFVLAPGSNCTLRVPASRERYRRAKLHLVQGSPVTVVYNASSGAPNLSKQQLSWPGKDPQSLVVEAVVGTVTIACGPGAACELQLQ